MPPEAQSCTQSRDAKARPTHLARDRLCIKKATLGSQKGQQRCPAPPSSLAPSSRRTPASENRHDRSGRTAAQPPTPAASLTVARLGLSDSLLETFKSTNPIESMISIARDVTGNVKRWKYGKMVVRRMAAGLLDADKRFRTVKGYRDMPMLRVALRRHHQGVESTWRSA